VTCGIFSFFILRAPDELEMYRRTLGGFVSYAREFLGEPESLIAEWMYYLNWAMTGVVDIAAVAFYMKCWGTFSDVPQWIFALVALAFVMIMNMVGVKWFDEIEFWFRWSRQPPRSCS
jgi:L-asparagine permease